jgi:alginate O-acetyltransferase complex protein AlgI
VVWGLYHGAGLAVTTGAQRWSMQTTELGGTRRRVYTVASWAATMLFVMFGWLLFFYPLPTALEMARLLVFRR